MHINGFSQIYMKLVTIMYPYKPSSIFCALKYTSFSFFPITNILVSSANKTKSLFIDISNVLLAFTKPRDIFRFYNLQTAKRFSASSISKNCQTPEQSRCRFVLDDAG